MMEIDVLCIPLNRERPQVKNLNSSPRHHRRASALRGRPARSACRNGSGEWMLTWQPAQEGRPRVITTGTKLCIPQDKAQTTILCICLLCSVFISLWISSIFIKV